MLKDILQAFIKKELEYEAFYLVLGTVENVDADAHTFDLIPSNGEAKIIGVQTKPTDSDSNAAEVVPTDGTLAVVGMSNRTKGFLILADSADKIIFRNGENGGLINVESNVDRLNKIEQKVNDLITKYNAHTHSGVTTGPGNTGAAAPPVSGSLTETTRGDIEDEFITH